MSLKDRILEANITMVEWANILRITPSTFSSKLHNYWYKSNKDGKRRVFKFTELEKRMIKNKLSNHTNESYYFEKLQEDSIRFTNHKTEKARRQCAANLGFTGWEKIKLGV